MCKKLFVMLTGLMLASCVAPSSDGSRVRYNDSVPDTSGITHSNTEETGDTETGLTSGMLVKPKDVTRTVLVVADTTREKAARNPEVMPNHVERANESVAMNENFASGNWTRPTAPAMMTGKNGFSLGANTYSNDEVVQVPLSVSTLGERFAEAGWATRADLCNAVAFHSEGMRGIEDVEICERPETNETTALQQFERSAEWMAEAGEHTFLVMVLMESHDPFNRPAAWCKDATKKATSACPGWTGLIEGFTWDQNNPEVDAACKAAFEAAYNCDSAQLDMELEEGFALWEEMGLLDNTLVYITADHGENLGEEHGNDENGFPLPTRNGHHGLMNTQVTKVDAVMTWPGVTPVAINDFPTGHADIAPTILDAVGIPYDSSEMEGESIFRLVEDPNAANRIIPQFACDSGGSENGAAYMVDGDVYHTILYHRKTGGDTWATYNVSEDPDEATPLVGYSIPEEIREMLQNQADTSKDWICE